MKASMVLALAGAALVAAGPIDKRVLKTEYVTDVVYVTVTVDPSEVAPTQVKHHRTKVTTTSTYTPTTTSSTSTSTTPTSTYVPPTTTTTPTSTSTPTTSSTSTSSSSSTASPSSTSSAVSTGSTTSNAASTSPTDYSSTAVYHHNIHRANHSASDVTWSSDLEASAAIVAATCKFEHQMDVNGGNYGQNLAAAGGSGDISGKDKSASLAESITNMWYNGEINSFPSDGYGKADPGGDFESWGHYSQVIWKATTEVGCATQFCGAGTVFDSMDSWYTVCNYRTAGNVGGEYGENVGEPLGEATVTAA